VNDKTAAKPAEKKFIYQVNADWLALRREEPIYPNLPIIDPHHHLWDRGLRYLFDELKDDTDSGGHNIRATVYLQCGSMYRAEGDPKFAPVGETEFVNGVAAMSASDIYGPARLCAGIVGFADLLLGAEVDAVLEAHLRAAGERFKGCVAPVKQLDYSFDINGLCGYGCQGLDTYRNTVATSGSAPSVDEVPEPRI
jgi:hypothetical protein